ncbi:MAG: hypothetical protein Kow0075_03460 [Salibacteraceae bacterium]
MKAILHQTIKGHSGAIYALATDEPKQLIYTGGADKVVACWDAATGHQVPPTIRTERSIYSLALLNNTMVVGTSTGSMHVIDLEHRAELKHFTFHTGGVFNLLPNGDKSLLLASAADGKITLWNTNTWELVAVMDPAGGKVRRTLFNDGDHTILAGCADGSVAVYDAESFATKFRFKAHADAVTALALTPDGMLLTGSKDAHLKLWELKPNASGLMSVPAHNFAIYDIAIIDNDHFATASRDKTIKIWSRDDMKVIQRIDRLSGGHIHSVNRLMWCPQWAKLVSASDDRSAKTWDVMR